MTRPRANVVICGAGIAGISAAYHLAVQRGVKDVVLVDERAPLSLTSDKSTECYRNWWPGPGDAMVKLMSRSIDLIEDLARESGNAHAAQPARLPLRDRGRGPHRRDETRGGGSRLARRRRNARAHERRQLRPGARGGI